MIFHFLHFFVEVRSPLGVVDDGPRINPFLRFDVLVAGCSDAVDFVVKKGLPAEEAESDLVQILFVNTEFNEFSSSCRRSKGFESSGQLFDNTSNI
jgi:hypothetical protein